MFRRRARLAVIALFAGVIGCTLITGVDDFEPTLEGDGTGGGGDSSAGRSDAPNGGSEGGQPNDGAADGDVDDPDTSTRIKDITFENGALVHPSTGGDRVVGDASLVTRDAGAIFDAGLDDSGDAIAPPPANPTSIAGNFSLHVDSTAFVEEDIGIDEVYVVARLRPETAATTTVTVLRVVPENGGAALDVRLLSTQRLQVTLGNAIIGNMSNPLVVGTVYRIGLYVKKGKNANGDVQASLAADGAAFGAPFATSTSVTFERPSKLQIGFPAAAAKATFDDVKIDFAQLAPP